MGKAHLYMSASVDSVKKKATKRTENPEEWSLVKTLEIKVRLWLGKGGRLGI